MAHQIEITATGAHEYSVDLHHAGQRSRHQVTVPEDLLGALGLSGGDEEALVRASFEFLLEREPPSSILARFDLDVIGRYFSDYAAAMRHRFGTGA